MSVIKYNGIDYFSPQPTPLVSRSVSYAYRADGRKLVPIDSYSLIGQITGGGCTNSFDNITGFQAILNNAFSKDFGTLSFEEVGFTGIVSGVKVNSITYEQSVMFGLVSYNISLSAYKEEYYESLGIIEKRNSWSVSQDENQNLTITHEMFAKGANTAPSYNNALTNAKNFVLSLTGYNPPAQFPLFIPAISGSLDGRTENINRLEGSYGITENYIGRTGSAISEELSVQLTSGIDGIIETSVQGSFKGGKNSNFDTLRLRYSGFNAFSVCTGVYNDYRGTTGLFDLPLSSGITEDYRENTLSFNISFNDFPTIRYRHIPTVQVTSGLDGIITTTINGDIQGLGRQKVRYDNAYNFFKTLNIYALANQGYRDYVGATYPFSLNTAPTASGTTLDRINGRIGYNATFSDKVLPLNCSGIKDFEWNVTKEYPMRVLRFGLVPGSTSGGCVQDLNYNTRASISVHGSTLVNPAINTSEAVVKQFINNKFRALYMQNRDSLLLDSASISNQPDKNSSSFDYTVSFVENAPINANISYTFITGLTL